MARIVAGTAGGRSITVPRSGTRPTSQRVREAVFGRLEHYGVLDGARVVDLYAGSGALGLEAASRGAAQVVLVDSSRAATRACQSNARGLGLAGVRTVTATASAFLSGLAGGPADLVLLDPPYDTDEAALAPVLQALARQEDPWLAPGSVVVLERPARSREPLWPSGLESLSSRRYGDTRVWFLQPARTG